VQCYKCYSATVLCIQYPTPYCTLHAARCTLYPASPAPASPLPTVRYPPILLSYHPAILPSYHLAILLFCYPPILLTQYPPPAHIPLQLYSSTACLTIMSHYHYATMPLCSPRPPHCRPYAVCCMTHLSPLSLCMHLLLLYAVCCMLLYAAVCCCMLYAVPQSASTASAIAVVLCRECTSDVRCQMSDARCQMSDVRCQMSDVRCQITDVRCQMSDVRCQS
jgi:hypothetical protein